MKITNKDQLKPLTFYRWKEKYNSKTVEDICFVTEIDTSSPGNYQCHGVCVKSIKSDLRVGRSYNFHYRWLQKLSKYKIEELSIDDIDKTEFFNWVFDSKSDLNRDLNYVM